MSSPTIARTNACPIGGKGTLQRLRRAAGYRSAKDFAVALGIPESTYARYERAGDGAECGIPLPAAWQIADKLGCSIGLVVGREDIDAPRPRASSRATTRSASRAARSSTATSPTSSSASAPPATAPGGERHGR